MTLARRPSSGESRVFVIYPAMCMCVMIRCGELCLLGVWRHVKYFRTRITAFATSGDLFFIFGLSPCSGYVPGLSICQSS